MKKILIALVLLVIGVVAASPYLIGSQIEKTSQHLVAKGNKQLATLAETNPQIESAAFSLNNYQKGYLNATADGVLKLSLLGLAPEPMDISIPYSTDITHGPYLGEAGFGLAKVVSRPDLSGFDLPESINEDTILIEGVVDFSQNMQDKVTVAPIKHTDESGTTLDFSGALITINSHLKNRSTFDADVAVEQLKMMSEQEENLLTLNPFTLDISAKGEESLASGTYEADSSAITASMGEGITIALQKMAMSGDYKKANGASLMLGDNQLTLSELEITNPGTLPAPLKLPKLTFKTTVEQAQNDDLSIAVNYLGTLDPSMMTLMRSPVDVKNAEIGLAFNAIPLSAMQAYQSLSSSMMPGAEPDAAAMQGQLFEILQMLANNAASTSLKVNATATEGELVADIDTGFKPDVNFDEAQMMSLLASPSPATILPLLVGRGDVSLSKGVTDKAGLTPMIQIIAAEFVTLKDDKFSAELKIEDGQLLINGTPLPLAPQ